MEFEFDPEKSASNLHKHGIDFLTTQVLWDDENKVEVPVRTEEEERWMLIGRIGEKHWSAIFTRREDRTRIISVRRARKEEVAIYES